MSKLDQDISEIEAFVAGLRISPSIATSNRNRSLFKSAYKQFHALLVWGMISEKQASNTLPVKTYFRETLSDVSHAFVLTLMHLYKPARTSLRGGVENLLRTLLLIRGVDATSINLVYELFGQAKSHFSGEPAISKNICQLESIYENLCKTVHSVKIDYMAQTVPFERICVFQNGQYHSNISSLRRVSAATNQAIFSLWHGELRKAGHVNEDLVRDAIPRTLKRAAGAGY